MNNLRNVNCNICDADNTCLITVQNNYKVVQCRTCGLTYVNPQPTQNILKSLYDEYHLRDGKDEHSWEHLMKRNFKELSAFLEKMFPEKGRILDIGCGYGHFLGIMKEHGWSVTGVDISAKVVSYGKRKGLDVRENTIDDAVFPGCSFDAVTAFYVLEHLIDPLSSLKKIFLILRPGGTLIVRVPHTTPIVRFLSIIGIKNNLYDLPFHLYDFSPKTIRQMLAKAGFGSVTVVPGAPTSPASFLPRIISVSSGYCAKLLYDLSGGILLVPGVSKTVVAMKPV